MNTLKLQNSIFKILIELFIFDKTYRMKVKSRWAKKQLEKYVQIALNKNIEEKPIHDEHIIWQYWHQGEEKAPLLIRKCLESIEKYHPEYKRVVLSYDNLADYVEIPSMYYDLVNQGKMSLTFFSDVIRCYLLTQYNGGTWIDSTIYLTDKIPNSILESKFFVFQKNQQIDRFSNKMSSFFIHSKGINKTLLIMKDVFMQYWKENDFLINYFLIEHLATMLSTASEELEKEWEQIPYFSAEDTGALQKVLFNKFNQEEFDKLRTLTNVHKLSYKILQENTSGSSYYDFLTIGGTN